MMKVEKEQFDDLLQRMLKQEPEKTREIKSEKKKGKIIPPKKVPESSESQ
jgi:hypothetical protein